LRTTPLVLALVGAIAGPAQSQTPADTLVTVFGFPQRTDSGTWRLILPEPLPAAGHRLSVLSARAPGDAGGWRKLEARFVEVVGRLSLPGGAPERAELAIVRFREIEPPGTSHRSIELSFSQQAVVTLAAIPVRFGWWLPNDRPSGVQPLLMYTIYNHGQTALDVMLPTNDALCMVVRAEEEPKGRGYLWHTSLPAPTRTGAHITVRLGALYRGFVPIPLQAAPFPGRYRAQVTVCGIPDYQVETAFEVHAP
jgi:hypothetical protein